MICTVIQRKGAEEILRLLDDPWIELAEIRLDLCDLSDREIEDIFSNTDTPLVATCRIGDLPEEECERRLSLAIRNGARYADLELEASAGFSKRFRDLCHEYGTEVIRSFHDFKGTPPPEFLQQVKARCFRYGADIAKIVTTATNPQDCAAVLSLYEEGGQDGGLIAFAMGAEGSGTRLECLMRGAPFTYASLESGLETASGQFTFEEMHRRIYGDFRGFWRVGDLQMPASKSFAQRAIICAALAEGRSHLRHYSPCEDSESAILVAQALGARIRRDGTTLAIDGTGAARTGMDVLHTGESGLLTRLCVPLMAVLNDRPVTINGERTLLERPLRGMQDIMASFGVVVRGEKVPVEIHPPLIPGNAEISGKDGSQLISGLMMALPLCGKNSTVYVSDPKSIPYMFITQDVLKKFGVKVKSEMEGDERMIEEQDWSGCSQVAFTIRGGQRYKAADLDLEGDWSAAANFLVAGAVFGKAEVSGLSTDSLQADLSIADILVQAGAVVSEFEGAVCVSKAPLEAFEADLGNAPDLFPICSVLAAFCQGITVLHGVGRLYTKESNRAAAILEMLTGLGVRAQIAGDDLQIEGETLTGRLMNGRLLSGGKFGTHHDHRMAMALKIAGMGASSPVVPDDADCVAKSFPGFWEMFDY